MDDAAVDPAGSRLECGLASHPARMHLGVGEEAEYQLGRRLDVDLVLDAVSGDFLGPWALLLTAYSPTLTSFGGGPGQIALHGRAGASLADPLGSARSHGCIRIPNGAILLLAGVAHEGTPVHITP